MTTQAEWMAMVDQIHPVDHIDHVLPESNSSLLTSFEKWHETADAKSCCDYSLHMDITNWYDGIREDLDILVQDKAYTVVVTMAKKEFFSISIASSQCCPDELSWVVQGLLHSDPKKDLIAPSVAHCDDFAQHFKDKIAQICHELDSKVDTVPEGGASRALSGPPLLDEFQLLWPEDVDKVLGLV
ncbi:Dihydropyrimidinase-related protein 1 [Varanus komodoensis]|nr:Dihydropyrimidinase-related protein 1 [Varanus komodoensis]